MVNLDEETREIQRALVDYDAGACRNVAVVGDPLSGKSTLVDAVISRYGQPIRKVSLTSIRDNVDDITAGAGRKGIITVDDCQYLFTRSIGGFEAVEKFLDIAVTSGRLYITTWNTFAWNYLEHVFDLPDYFPVIVAVPAMDTGGIEAIIGASYDLGKIRYIDDAKNNGPLVKLKWDTVRLKGSAIKIPYIAPGTGILDSVSGKDSPGIRQMVFRKITELSNGNPGVAMAIWQKAYSNEEIRTGNISIPEFDTDLDPDEAFMLSNLLMMKSATENDLLKITGGHLKMDRILYALADRGLIRKTSDRFSIEPLALYNVIQTLKESRQVW